MTLPHLVFTGVCHNQLPLLQKQSNKKESRVEQKTRINVFSDYSLGLVLSSTIVWWNTIPTLLLAMESHTLALKLEIKNQFRTRQKIQLVLNSINIRVWNNCPNRYFKNRVQRDRRVFTCCLVVYFVLIYSELSWQCCESSRKEVLFWFWHGKKCEY